MASTACFLSYIAPLPASRKPLLSRGAYRMRTLSRAQKVDQESGNVVGEDGAVAVVSRRVAVSLMIGAAAVGSRASPADAAYGEAGNDSLAPVAVAEIFVVRILLLEGFQQ
uniref:Uncharacterized protein n=1 Tax=Kalanchoe fedtschenkoi TaxID=63787 RepID=A0A7N0VMQ5_KALFE